MTYVLTKGKPCYVVASTKRTSNFSSRFKNFSYVGKISFVYKFVDEERTAVK